MSGEIPIIRPDSVDPIDLHMKDWMAGRARIAAMESLKEMLEPYEVALHGALNYYAIRPEEVLLRRKKAIQLVFPSQTDEDHYMFISMTAQTPVSKRQMGSLEQLQCQRATFCHAYEQELEWLKRHTISFHPYPFGLSFIPPMLMGDILRDIPRSDLYGYSVEFRFDRKGKIQDIYYFDKRRNYEEEKITRYSLKQDQPDVWTYWSYQSNWQPASTDSYVFRKGTYRRRFSDSSIEEDIKTILDKLHFESIRL